LRARDLVPLLSYLARRGWCSCGRARLSRFHPGIELAAVAVALTAATVLSGWLPWASLGLGWALLALAAIDWREFVLPGVITLPLIPARPRGRVGDRSSAGHSCSRSSGPSCLGPTD
jgi:leader peptidase (prepilin peptidase)/N-methyltransferase